jgi:hypothetical protein
MRLRFAPATVTVCLAAIASVAAAVPAVAAIPRQTGTLTFTSTVPGTVSGHVLDVVFQNPDDPNAKPYATAQMVIHMPSGTVVDTTVPPQCHATDAEILVLGPAACPADTWIGSGFARSDNGPPDSETRYSNTTLTHFNNQDEVVGIGVNDDIPALKTIDRTKYEGETSTSTFPAFPGFPPPEPYTPVKELYVNFPPYTRNGRNYNTTPPTCPKAGYWTFTIEFRYRDGVTEFLESHSPCGRARRSR